MSLSVRPGRISRSGTVPDSSTGMNHGRWPRSLISAIAVSSSSFMKVRDRAANSLEKQARKNSWPAIARRISSRQNVPGRSASRSHHTSSPPRRNSDTSCDTLSSLSRTYETKTRGGMRQFYARNSSPPNGIACELRGRFHVPKPQRRGGCSDCAAPAAQEHVGRRAAGQPCSTEALQRRAEARPRRLHTLVRRRRAHSYPCTNLRLRRRCDTRRSCVSVRRRRESSTTQRVPAQPASSFPIL